MKKKKNKSRENIGKISSIVGILLNIMLSISKILVGVFSGFISILADGLNNLSDCGSSAVSYMSFKLSSPAFEPWVESTPPPPFFPIYRLSEGLTQKQIAQNIKDVLPLAAATLPDPLPEKIRIKYKLCTIHFALKQIHSPDSYASLSIAKRRLIFDEFFVFALGGVEFY